jgi:hypothetical protein
MHEELPQAFYDDGWIVECESPLEIYYTPTGSRATGYGAKLIVIYYILLELGKDIF